MMHWGNLSGMGIGGFGFGWIFMILFWVLVILGIVYIGKQLIGGKRVHTTEESALGILKERYASGEISRDEYYDKKAVIAQSK